MAKTTSDNLISNLSYTEKDFQTIYPALLDLVKKETSKWDPSASNESDPGVLLLKLNAIIADKCNYNIDKNVLECFPVSVTQDQNARQIFEQLGYYMHWYRAANSSMTLKWIGARPVDEEGNEKDVVYTIPRFTMFSNKVNELTDSKSIIVYSTTVPRSLSTNGSSTYIPALQGVAKKYELNGSTTITVANLDSNNRLYFNESNIAENGIFITNVDADNYELWIKKDNLLIEELSSANRYYKFGLSQDLNTCYLEFPENAEEIFQEGINITYLVTAGIDGTTAAKEITTLYDTLTVVDPTVQVATSESTNTDDKKKVLTTDDISISNFVASYGGQNPETIDDAYRNYKKVVGTFQTLVTLRDYMNALRRSEYLSNGIISDRTSDIQSSYDIMSQTSSINQSVNQIAESKAFDKIGYYNGNDFFEDEKYTTLIEPNEQYNYKSKNEFIDYETGETYPAGTFYRIFYKNGIYHYMPCDPVVRPEMNAFDLKMYILSASPIMIDATDFNKTFELNIDGSVADTVAAEINQYKCVQHDFIDLESNKLCFIKVKYPINCKIVPQYSLSETQRDELLANVKKALFNNLNASKIEFGQELDFEEVYNIIIDADSRIKTISLDPIEYTPYVVYLYKNPDILDPTIVTPEVRELNISEWFTTNIKDGRKVDKYIDWDNPINQFMKEIYAKSVLAGKTQFFIKDSSFDYGINQKYQLLENDIGRLDTNLRITLDSSNDWQYAVRENEVIQLYAPNLIESASYSSNVKVEYHLFNSIKASATHKLLPGEYVIFYWLGENADSGYKYAAYGEGTIISPSFNMVNSVDVYALVGNILLAKLKPVIKNDQTYYYATGDTASDPDLAIDITVKVRALTDSTNILSGTKKVSILLQNSILIDNKYSCYWILNDSVDGEYVLFDKTLGKSRILGNGEYFIYTLNNAAEYTILGSGTEIYRNTVTQDDRIVCDATLSYDDIVEKGLTAISTANAWKNIDSTTLSIIEMQYISFGEGCVVQIKPNANTVTNEYDAGALYELKLQTSTEKIEPNTPYNLKAETSPGADNGEYLVFYQPIVDNINYYLWEIKSDEWTLVDPEKDPEEYKGCYKASFSTAGSTAAKHLRINSAKASYTDYMGFKLDGTETNNTVTVYFKFLNPPTMSRAVKLYCICHTIAIYGPGSSVVTDPGSSSLSGTTSKLIAERLIREYKQQLSEYKYVTTTTAIDDELNSTIEGITDILDAGLTTKSSRTIGAVTFDSKSSKSLYGTTIQYKESADATEWKTLSQMQFFDEDYSWQVNTLLRLSCSADISQKLQPGQDITYYKWDPKHKWIVLDDELHHREYPDPAEWEIMRPHVIDPEVFPFANPTYILTSKGVDELGPKINLLSKKDDGNYKAASIYAYILDDSADKESILFLDSGTTQVVFRNNADQIQTKKITFKLPAGNYIMPMQHDTDNSADNNYGISYLKLFLARKVLTNITDLTHYQFTFNNDIKYSYNFKTDTRSILDGQDGSGNGIWNIKFKNMPEKAASEIPEVPIDYIATKIKFEGTSDTYVDKIYYWMTSITEDNPDWKLVYDHSSLNKPGWQGAIYQSIQCLDNSFMDANLYYFWENADPLGWLIDNINLETVEEELISMSDAADNNMYKPGNYYLKVNNLPDNNNDGNFFVSVYVTIHYTLKSTESKVPAITVLIPKIFKYNNTTWVLDSSDTELNDILNADLFIHIYDKIKELDFNHLFNYTYVVDEDVEIKNPLAGRSFLDSNHIMNPYSICQLDTSDEAYNIQVTNVLRRNQ